MPESAYLSKRSKVRIASRVYTFEYHILYNLNYSVPVLLFNAYASGNNNTIMARYNFYYTIFL